MAVSCKNWQEPDVNSPTFVTDVHCHWLVETSGRQLIIDRWLEDKTAAGTTMQSVVYII